MFPSIDPPGNLGSYLNFNPPPTKNPNETPPLDLKPTPVRKPRGQQNKGVSKLRL